MILQRQELKTGRWTVKLERFFFPEFKMNLLLIWPVSQDPSIDKRKSWNLYNKVTGDNLNGKSLKKKKKTVLFLED